MKTFLTTLILFSFLAALASAQQGHAMYDDQRPEMKGAEEAAALALRSLGELVTKENYQALGFDSPDQARAGRLGVPVEQFTIGLDRLKAYSQGADAGQLLTSTQTLTYPVLVDNRTRSSVTVSRHAGHWKTSSFGSPNYIKALTELRDRQTASQAGAAPFEVKVPALNLAFLARREGSKVIVAPLFDDPRFGFKRGEEMAFEEALQKILPSARAHNGLPT